MYLLPYFSYLKSLESKDGFDSRARYHYISLIDFHRLALGDPRGDARKAVAQIPDGCCFHRETHMHHNANAVNCVWECPMKSIFTFIAVRCWFYPFQRQPYCQVAGIGDNASYRRLLPMPSGLCRGFPNPLAVAAPTRSSFRRSADLEIADTAGLETCGTVAYPTHLAVSGLAACGFEDCQTAGFWRCPAEMRLTHSRFRPKIAT